MRKKLEAYVVVAIIFCFSLLLFSCTKESSSEEQPIEEVSLISVTVEQASLQGDPTKEDYAYFLVSFSKDISPSTFSESDVVISGGFSAIISSFDLIDNAHWLLKISGIANSETISVHLPASVVSDLDGVANQRSFSYDNRVLRDTTPPVATLSSQYTVNSFKPIPFTLDFNEEVDVVTQDMLSVTNGTIDEFEQHFDHYTFSIDPTDNGMVTVTLPAGSVADRAKNYNGEATHSVFYVPAIELTARLGDADSLVSFKEEDGSSVTSLDFLRSRDADCYWPTVLTCTLGASDTITGDEIKTDTTFTRTDSSYYVVDYNGYLSNALTVKNDEALILRNFHQVIDFNNKLWIIGGLSSDLKFLNDIWSSSDGIHWDPETPTLNVFSKRIGHQVIIFDNKLWLIGGYDGSYKSDVWSSDDGIAWNRVTNSADFGGLMGHQAIVYDDEGTEKMYVIAGYNGKTSVSYIWSSDDGANWDYRGTGGFHGRWGHQLVKHDDDTLWILGGHNDAFNGFSKFEGWFTQPVVSGASVSDTLLSSTDGINWTDRTTDNIRAVTSRWGHQLLFWDGKFWLIAGSNVTDYTLNNEIRSSIDGVTWALHTDDAPFSARAGHQAVKWNASLWIVGMPGNVSDGANDIWYTSDGDSWRNIYKDEFRFAIE